jgi:hypothetical protein
MTQRTFTDIHRARTMLRDMPPGLMLRLEDAEKRETRWELHFCRTERIGAVWTLLIRQERENLATQWTDQGTWSGKWIPSREAVLFDEDDRTGLFNMEGRQIPKDEEDQAEEEGADLSRYGNTPESDRTNSDSAEEY